LPGGLTGGAMPVPAAVVAVTYHPAMVAGLFVSTHGRRTASSYLSQHLSLQGCEGIGGSELMTKEPDYIGQS
jgi:hypothetical protein